MVDDCSPTHSLESVFEYVEPDKRILNIKSPDGETFFILRISRVQ